MHYVGDSHQPLHGVSRVDNAYPAGDRGGNDVHLPSRMRAKNLHAVWDEVVYEFHVNPKLPFNSDSWALLGDEASKLMADHPVSSLTGDVTNLDPAQW